MQNRKRNALWSIIFFCLGLALLFIAEPVFVLGAESQEEYIIGLGWSERILPGTVKKGDSYTYQSENEAVVTVSQDGILTGAGYGSTRIKLVRHYGKNKKSTSYIKVTCKKAGIKKDLKLTVTPETVQISPYEILECVRDKAVYEIASEDERLELAANGTIQRITSSGRVYLQVKETYQKKTREVGRIRVTVELPVEKQENIDSASSEEEVSVKEDYILEVHPAAKAPKKLTAASQNTDTISLKWSSVSCDGYELYRQERNGEFTFLKGISAKQRGYQDSALVTGRHYLYKLVPYRMTGGAKKFGEAVYIAGTPAPGRVTLTLTEKKSSLKLSWKSIEKAKQYLIFRAEKKDGSYQNIASVEAPAKAGKLIYTDTDILPGKRYYYKVQVCAENAGLLVYGQESKRQSGKQLAPAQVSWMAASYRAGKGLQVFWKKVKGTDGYIIYSSTNGKNGWKQIATLSSDKKSYTDSSWNASKGTYIRVRAFCKREEQSYEGASSPIVNARTLFCKGYEGYSTEEKIEVLRALFPDGTYWNHKGSSLTGLSANETCFLISGSPCSHELTGYGSCNIYNGNTRFATDPQYSVNMQCLGFASMISDFLFGKSTSITQFRGFDRLKVGDHVRLTDWDHSMIIVKKRQDYIQVVECNRNFEDCLIEWDRTLTRAQLERMNYVCLRKQA